MNLTRLNPKSAWPWRHSIRTALAVTVPLAIGLLVGQLEASLLVALGALLNSVKVRSDPYRARFRSFLIIVPIAMTGFVLGALVAGHGPLTLMLLIGLGLVSGLISGYGATYSTGAMQMLILAVIAAGHASGSIWVPPLLFASGALYAALLLAIEAAFDRRMPERAALAQLFHALAQLARSAAQPAQEKSAASLATPLEQQRRHVTDAMLKAYSGLLQTRLADEGSTPETDRHAVVLASADLVFSGIVAGGFDPAELHGIAHYLDEIATAVRKGHGRPKRPADLPEASGLGGRVDNLADSLWPDTVPPRPARRARAKAAAAPVPDLATRLRALAARLALGQDVVVSALQLALCLGIAFAVQDILGGARSYWIPLCVVIVLKPDFGSVFVRAVQRSLGTIVGVAIGVVLLTFIPKGWWLLASMGVLGAVIPAAGQRSYAMQCAVLTPLVLILIDMTVPGATVDFGPQRLVDTLIGSAIALVFGYLVWPRDPGTQILASFTKAMSASAAYLRAAAAPVPADEAELPASRSALLMATMAAYSSLSNVRTTLQRAIAEPPPASREAAAWFPVVVEAERLCDRITRLAQQNATGAITLDPAAVEPRVAVLKLLGAEAPAKHAPVAEPGKPAADGDAAFREIDLELDQLTRMLEPAR
ncbi:FUSC family protein [Kaistia sp. 32K]|uniref:FUSC family protein n=1 Tax=Kaistia sp. 32K TaxID=2795690 RepID=UPI001915D9C6|nr:FUSC family protein [Kaistia sp. 32K]